MKTRLLFLILSISIAAFSQKKTFTQFEISFPLRVNPEFNFQGEDFFIPDGISSKFGYGVRLNDLLGLSIHGGIDYKIISELVSTPIYGQLTVLPKMSVDSRLLFQAGLGRTFAIGRGNLSGPYLNFKFGVTNGDAFSIFIDFASFGYNLHREPVRSLSLGFALITF